MIPVPQRLAPAGGREESTFAFASDTPGSVDPAAGTSEFRRAIARRYAQTGNLTGLAQVASTLLPLAALWAVAAHGAIPLLLLVVTTLAMSLFLLRSFALMHECGHGSLFRNPLLNRAAGFVFGVVSGMPQYVWAQHHAYHHATNGDWARYRGPLAILSIGEYRELTARQQRAYVRARNILMAPLAGLLYLVVNPRLTWIRGCAGLIAHLVRAKWAQPAVSLRTHAASFETRHWKSATEFRHMTLNNVVLLSGWALMCAWMGPSLFFPVYLASTSLAGAAGIVLFTVQHNFEHAYASADPDWDIDVAAIHGTSYLVLPAWLNWFTADIGYHHVHHLCARIPNGRLSACHDDHPQLFADVRRLTLADVLPSLKFLLWEPASRRIISIAEFEAGHARTA